MKLISNREVRDLLHISQDTLSRWVKAGQFPAPAIRRYHQQLWKADDVNAYIEANAEANQSWQAAKVVETAEKAAKRADRLTAIEATKQQRNQQLFLKSRVRLLRPAA